MCDTLCAPGPAGMVFAKNSDRPPGEVQVAWPFGRRASAGCTLRTQYLSIGDTGAHAALLSCPTWLWGAEHGVNEHGVAIGNERVRTTHDAQSAPPALIGMDLVRLGLERARSAAEAVDVMTGLLEACGQGGIADAAHQEAYDSSFLVADPHEAYVLETAGADYAAAPFPGGAAISNRITLGSGWTRASAALEPGDDFGRFRDPGEHTAYADVRLAASRRFLESTPVGGLTPAATAAHLRDHGSGPWGAPGTSGPVVPPPAGIGDDFGGVTVCMHVRDLSVTAASMIAELPSALADGAPLRVYVAAGSPCASIYVPAFPRTANGPPPFVPVELSGEELWYAADALRRRVEADPGALAEVRADPPAGRGRAVGRRRRRTRATRPLGRVGCVVGEPCAACAACLHPLNLVVTAIRCDGKQPVRSYSPKEDVMTYVLSPDDIEVGDAVTGQLEKMWGWYLAGGIIAIIFGFFVISWRHATVYAAIYFASAFFIVGGAFEIVGSVRMARQRWMHLVFGLFWVGAGIVGFVWPHITVFVAAVLIGWSFLVLGIFDIVSSLQHHHLPFWWAYLIRGIVAIALGLLCIRHPTGTLEVVMVMIGILAILFGVVEVIGAFSARHATRYWEAYKKQQVS